jgi:hypothetical protein
VVPGTVNAEAIAINKDHIGMAKFDSPQDDDFQTICGHIRLMVGNAPKRIAERWQRNKKREGMWLF